VPLATGCPSPRSSSASSCSSQAAARHGSSMPHAFASPTRVRTPRWASQGSVPCLEGLGEHPAGGEQRGSRGWGEAGSSRAVMAATSPHAEPLGCFMATAPEDAALVLLASEQGAERRTPCPGPAQCWDQQGWLCSDSLWASPGVSWAAAELGSPRLSCSHCNGDTEPQALLLAPSSASHQHSPAPVSPSALIPPFLLC